MIIEYCTNFRLNGEHWWAVQYMCNSRNVISSSLIQSSCYLAGHSEYLQGTIYSLFIVQYELWESLDQPVTTCMGNSCSPGCPDDVFDGVFLGLSFFPRDVLDEIWDLIEPVSENFPTYSFINRGRCKDPI